MIEVEVDNRSGTAVDGEGTAALVRRVLEAEGIDDGDVGIAFVGPQESRALKREHLGVDEATDTLSFRVDGREDVPTGLPRSPATSSSARRSWATTGARRSCTATCTCSATTTAPRWRRARRRCADGRPPAAPRPGPRAEPARLFNYAFEGIIHALRTQRTCGSTS